MLQVLPGLSGTPLVHSPSDKKYWSMWHILSCAGPPIKQEALAGSQGQYGATSRAKLESRVGLATAASLMGE